MITKTITRRRRVIIFVIFDLPSGLITVLYTAYLRSAKRISSLSLNRKMIYVGVENDNEKFTK